MDVSNRPLRLTCIDKQWFVEQIISKEQLGGDHNNYSCSSNVVTVCAGKSDAIPAPSHGLVCGSRVVAINGRLLGCEAASDTWTPTSPSSKHPIPENIVSIRIMLDNPSTAAKENASVIYCYHEAIVSALQRHQYKKVYSPSPLTIHYTYLILTTHCRRLLY